MEEDSWFQYKFKDLKKYKSKDPLLLMYIPVLDKDPTYACEYLTRSDLIDSYKLLKEVFKEIEKGKIKHEILADTILYCKENFKWYSVFAKEAAKILKEDEIKIPYEKVPRYVKRPRTKNFREPVKVQQPFGVYYNEKRKNYYVEELKFNKETNDPINNYRIKYILDQYELSEFVGASYPSWYSLTDLTIFEKYCTKTNTRVRIDFKDGNLHYFIAGASDNWREIENVPSSMIYVIFALLFRTIDVNTTESEY